MTIEKITLDKAQVERIEKAINFYANKENYWTYPVPGGYASAVSVDGGRKAREAIRNE